MRGLFVGRATVDLIQAVRAFPGADDKVSAEAKSLSGGGPALNAAVTFAHLGGEAVLAARVGAGNLLSDLLRHECESYGVDLVDLAGGSDYQPPVSGVLSTVTTGERCCVNTDEEGGDRPAEVAPPAPAGFDVILLDQFQRDVLREHRAAFLESGVPRVLDGGSWKPWSQEILDLVTLPVVSERYLEAAEETPLDFFHRKGFARWAVTRGAKGLDYCDGGAVHTLPAPQVTAIDTLGAGDIFHGAFCYYTARGDAFPDALAHASAVAAEACRHLGPRAWMAGG